jgi:hypothetical protein
VFAVVDAAGNHTDPLIACRSDCFYAYSHPNVLTQRLEVDLFAVSPAVEADAGTVHYLIGGPFTNGRSLAVSLCNEDLSQEVLIRETKYFSPSVLIVSMPKLPSTFGSNTSCHLRVSNNRGRTWTRPQPINYYDPSGTSSNNGRARTTRYKTTS